MGLSWIQPKTSMCFGADAGTITAKIFFFKQVVTKGKVKQILTVLSKATGYKVRLCLERQGFLKFLNFFI